MPASATHCMRQLVAYAADRRLIDPEDTRYTFNRLLEIMRMDAPEPDDLSADAPDAIEPMLDALCDAACARGLIEDTTASRDRFSAKLAGEITPHPAQVRERFAAIRAKSGIEAATDWFYDMCRACGYIQTGRIAKNVRYEARTSCGELEITINLSKPEKDPRDIAMQRQQPQNGYPRCMLCPENPGYAGNHAVPARHNHRAIPIRLGGEKWLLQYSPYLYFDEHCIALNEAHRPMRVDEASIGRLFDFVEQFPHYFIGSNADLPIVGGSILTHDHFQGGRHIFPMDRAGARAALVAPEIGVEACVVDWPMSVLRLKGERRDALIRLAVSVLNAWRAYSDPSLGILAETDAPHNTITPILRREGTRWKLDLVLRNNRRDDTHPDGIFHPHAEKHHIKKENIGLIEVMGLFILPGRLLGELGQAICFLTGARSLDEAVPPADPVAKHIPWLREIAARNALPLSETDARDTLRREVAETCAGVLADAGVYKRDAAGLRGMLRFLESVGYAKA